MKWRLQQSDVWNIFLSFYVKNTDQHTLSVVVSVKQVLNQLEKHTVGPQYFMLTDCYIACSSWTSSYCMGDSH